MYVFLYMCIYPHSQIPFLTLGLACELCGGASVNLWFQGLGGLGFEEHSPSPPQRRRRGVQTPHIPGALLGTEGRH